jgi:hypothetical protein
VDFFFNLPILNLLFPSMFQALGAAAAFKLAFTYKKVPLFSVWPSIWELLRA